MSHVSGIGGGDVSKFMKTLQSKLDGLGLTTKADLKTALQDVIKDAFSGSSKPGGTIHAEIGGKSVNLPNPIGELANKLIGAGRKDGIEIPTSTGGRVSVPPFRHRAQSGQLPTGGSSAAGLGGGGGGSSPVSGSPAPTPTSFGNSPGSVTSYNGNPLAPLQNSSNTGGSWGTALSTLSTDQNSLEGSIQSMISALSGSGLTSGQIAADQAQLSLLQNEMSQINEMFTTLSQLMADDHQTKMQIIGNIK